MREKFHEINMIISQITPSKKDGAKRSLYTKESLKRLSKSLNKLDAKKSQYKDRSNSRGDDNNSTNVNLQANFENVLNGLNDNTETKEASAPSSSNKVSSALQHKDIENFIYQDEKTPMSFNQT